MTDTGLAHYVQIVRAPKRLSLQEGKVTDAGLSHLAYVPSLMSLNLESTAITDIGLKAIVGLTRLKALSLCHTRVTDHSLDYIAQLPNLKSLDLSNLVPAGSGMSVAWPEKTRGSALLAALCICIPGRSQRQTYGDSKKALPNCEIWTY